MALAVQRVKIVRFSMTEKAQSYIAGLPVDSLSKFFLIWSVITDELRGDPVEEYPLPGFNVCVQIVLHSKVVNDRREILRVVLPEIEDDPLEFDVLSILAKYDVRSYLHPQTLFFDAKSPLV